MESGLVLISTVLQVAAYGFVGVKLLRSRLAAVYRHLTLLVLFECLRVTVAGFLPRNEDVYAWFYIFTQPLLWLFYALVTLEVFQVALRAHPGIAAMSRRVVSGAVIAAGLLSAATLMLLQPPESAYGVLESFFTIERVVLCSLLVFVLLLVLYLAWFPIPLSRNALVHAMVFTFFFGTSTGALLVRTMFGPEAGAVASISLVAATLISLSLWGTLLTPEGERQRVKSGYRRTPEQEDRLLAQLDDINRTLIGSARK